MVDLSWIMKGVIPWLLHNNFLSNSQLLVRNRERGSVLRQVCVILSHNA